MKWKNIWNIFLPNRSMNAFLISQIYMCISDNDSGPWPEFSQRYRLQLFAESFYRRRAYEKCSFRTDIKINETFRNAFSLCILKKRRHRNGNQKKQNVWTSLYKIFYNFYSHWIYYARHELDRFNEFKYSITVKLFIIVLCVSPILLLLLILLEFPIIRTYYYSFILFFIPIGNGHLFKFFLDNNFI